MEFCRTTYGVPHTVPFQGDVREAEQIREITGSGKYSIVTERPATTARAMPCRATSPARRCSAIYPEL